MKFIHKCLVAITFVAICISVQAQENQIRFGAGNSSIPTILHANTIVGNIIVSQRIGDNGAWQNQGEVFNCSTYSPATNTVTQGQEFIQKASCSINQTRTG